MSGEAGRQADGRSRQADGRWQMKVRTSDLGLRSFAVFPILPFTHGRKGVSL
jgi:hypothetical protein